MALQLDLSDYDKKFVSTCDPKYVRPTTGPDEAAAGARCIGGHCVFAVKGGGAEGGAKKRDWHPHEPAKDAATVESLKDPRVQPRKTKAQLLREQHAREEPASADAAARSGVAAAVSEAPPVPPSDDASVTIATMPAAAGALDLSSAPAKRPLRCCNQEPTDAELVERLTKQVAQLSFALAEAERERNVLRAEKARWEAEREQMMLRDGMAPDS